MKSGDDILVVFKDHINSASDAVIHWSTGNYMSKGTGKVTGVAQPPELPNSLPCQLPLLPLPSNSTTLNMLATCSV